MEEQRPPGYRFYPTEEELVGFYLPNQLRGNGGDNVRLVIPVVDVYDTEPWNLPSLAGELCRNDKEQWFFFAPRQEKEARGGRPNRSTAAGYWKATGSPSYVYSSELRVIGLKKTMVFYRGKAPSGTKTKWKMNEYKAIIGSNPASIPSSTAAVPQLRNEFTLCRVYVGSGCARAFDRRPLELGPSGESMLHSLAVLPGVDGEEQGCDHQTLESPEASPNPGLEAAGWLELDWDEL